MGEIIIHAGRRKAGSTSIQQWLVTHVTDLRGARCAVVVPRDANPPGPMLDVLLEDVAEADLDQFETGFSRGMFRLTGYLRGLRTREVRPSDEDALASFPYFPVDSVASELDALCGELAEFAKDADRVVLSSEALDEFLFQDDQLLAALQGLTENHSVRVAYYVAPQDSALEREWRFQGFRWPLEPSEWVRRFAPVLDHGALIHRAARIAPDVDLTVRPFRKDLIVGGGPAADFAAEFLGFDLSEEGLDVHANVGLPLDLVIALRSAPPKLIGLGRLGFGSRLARLKRIPGLDVPPSKRVERSRMVLSAFAFETFSSSNLRWMESLGLQGIDFVADPGVNDWSLEELDRLWVPSSDSADLALLHAALIAATE